MKKINKFVIQGEIKVTQKWIDNIIKKYKKMGENMRLCFGDFYGNKKDIIREIKNKTEIGKSILMTEFRYENSEFIRKLRKEK